MAQHDYVIANGTGAAVRSDLNNALAAIVSQNSGATAPATTYAYQFWADTTTNLLKLRNSANSAWITLFQLDGEWSTLPVENGTAAAPSIYFKDSGTDTGFYSPGTDQVAVSTAGTGRLFINSSGSVGIGTSSPGQLLDVAGIARFGANATKITTYSDSTYAGFFNGSSLTSNESIYMGAGGTYFYNNGGASVTIDASRRVGIGVTSPGSILDINGPITLRSSGTVRGYLGDVDGDTHIQIRSESGQISFKKGNNEIARFDTSSRFLLGTSSAETWYGSLAQIQYNGSEASFMAIRNSANSQGAALYLGKSRGTTPNSATIVQSGDNLGEINFLGADGTDLQTIGAQILATVDGTPGSNDLPTRLVFSTTADGASSPTEHARITSDGYFKASSNGSYSSVVVTGHQLYQTESDWTTLFVNTAASLPYGIYVRYTGTSPNNTGSPYFAAYDNGPTLRAEIRSNGGLANFSANNANLSDRNAKKDISPAAGTWDCIKEWEIVNYRYKDQPDDADLNLGVIAQQVAESCPEVITVFEEAKDDQPEKLGIKEQQMYWMAIKALQEAQVRIEQLEAKVAALESA